MPAVSSPPRSNASRAGATASSPPRRPPGAGGLFDTVRGFWKEYGRDGEPRLVAQVNVALGPQDVLDDARARMHAYYAFTGMPDRTVAGLLTQPAEIRSALTAFAGLGADEVVLCCYGLDPDQVDRLADVLWSRSPDAIPVTPYL